MRSQRGMAMAIALLIAAVALSLAAAYLTVAGQAARTDDVAYRAEQVYQAADAGLNLAAAVCSSESACQNWRQWGNKFGVDTGDPTGPSFSLTLGSAQPAGGGHQYLVTATGSANLPRRMGGSGQAQRQLRLQLSFDSSGRLTSLVYLGS